MQIDSGLNHRLKEARELRGFSVEQAANLAGVTVQTYRDWEAGRKAPRVNRLMMVAGLMGVAVMWLLNGDDDLDPNEATLSKLDRLAGRLDLAVKRSQALDTELRAIASEMSVIRRLNAELDHLAEH